MKKSIIYFIIIFVLMLSTLVACSKEKDKEEDNYSLEELEEYVVSEIKAYKVDDNTYGLKVASSVSLPKAGNVDGTSINWLSESPDFIDNDGNIKKRDENIKEINFECNLGYKDKTKKVYFKFKLASKSFEDVKLEINNSIPSFITSNVELKENIGGIDIAWSSSNEEVLTNAGVYTKPNEDKDIIIIYVLSDSNNSIEESLNVVANGKSDLELFEECKTWIRTDGFSDLYLDKDVNLPSKYKGTVDLSWSTTNSNIIEANGKIHQTYYDRYAYLTCKMEVSDQSYEVRMQVKVLALPLDGVNEKELTEAFVKEIALEKVSQRFFPLYTNINQYYGFLHFYTKASSNITEYIASVSDKNRPGTIKPSIEYITVHDTANNSKGAHALAHAKYVSQGGDGTSWHYSVDENGVYHQIPDNEVAYHAGDGTRFFALMDTGIKATVKMPQVYMKDGNFYIMGQNTNIRPYADKEATTFVETNYTTEDIGKLGVIVEIGENGNYFIGRTYFNTTYNYVSNYGGNRNSIGIETCVDNGSDYNHTYRNVAKLCAELCIQNNLSVDRVKGHHFFSGKPCPNAILTADYWADFLTLVSAEKFAKEHLSELTFIWRPISSNITKEGYINSSVKKGDVLEYKVQVEKNSVKVYVGSFKTIIE